MKCAWKICKNEVSTTQKTKTKKFCSIKCKNKQFVTKRRRKVKVLAVQHLGGKCQMCGYDKCIGALEFHHKNPGEKDFQISSGRTISLQKILAEVDKCMLLCSNCHREAHHEPNQ
jgi:hypothetical protein